MRRPVRAVAGALILAAGMLAMALPAVAVTPHGTEDLQPWLAGCVAKDGLLTHPLTIDLTYLNDADAPLRGTFELSALTQTSAHGTTPIPLGWKPARTPETAELEAAVTGARAIRDAARAEADRPQTPQAQAALDELRTQGIEAAERPEIEASTALIAQLDERIAATTDLAEIAQLQAERDAAQARLDEAQARVDAWAADVTAAETSLADAAAQDAAAQDALARAAETYDAAGAAVRGRIEDDEAIWASRLATGDDGTAATAPVEICVPLNDELEFVVTQVATPGGIEPLAEPVKVTVATHSETLGAPTEVRATSGAQTVRVSGSSDLEGGTAIHLAVTGPRIPLIGGHPPRLEETGGELPLSVLAAGALLTVVGAAVLGVARRRRPTNR